MFSHFDCPAPAIVFSSNSSLINEAVLTSQRSIEGFSILQKQQFNSMDDFLSQAAGKLSRLSGCQTSGAEEEALAALLRASIRPAPAAVSQHDAVLFGIQSHRRQALRSTRLKPPKTRLPTSRTLRTFSQAARPASGSSTLTRNLFQTPPDVLSYPPPIPEDPGPSSISIQPSTTSQALPGEAPTPSSMTLPEFLRLKINANACVIKALQTQALKQLPGGNQAPTPVNLQAAVAAIAEKSANLEFQHIAITTTACTEGLLALRATAASNAARAAARAAHLQAAHAAAKKAWREARTKAQRDRLDALKSDDLEAYLKLAQTAKSAQIDRLLSETDACLRKLGTRLNVNLAADSSAPTDITPMPASATAVDAPSADPSSLAATSGTALHQSSEAWGALATAFAADVSHQPAALTGGELREYQMQGLRWMVSLRNAKLNGILADEMGLGKTVQVIALVTHCLQEALAASSSGCALTRGPFLIAAPASVLPNWEKEFETWAPSVRVVAYRGPADDREIIFRSKLRKTKGGACSFDVVLTSYDFLMGKNDRPRLGSIGWSYIIVDEGHRLKNAGCKLNAELREYRADHRLLLTGTPLQNNVNELWALLNFLLPDVFDSADDFETWFGGSMRKNTAAANCSAAAACSDSDEEDAAVHAAMLSEEEILVVTNRLHQVLRPFMLRRLKVTVAGELPAKTEHLIPCLPAPYQQALFQVLCGELQGPGGARGVSNALMEARVICNHPLISRLHVESSEAELPRHPLPCEVRLCGKLEVLDRVLLKLKAAGHRVLIFCTMTRLLDVLEGYLEWRGLHFLRLDGSTKAADRGALVEEFNAPGSEAFAFLLSVRAGGVGLNLQAADTVIFYDTDWNPQIDAQAAARVHRIGQTKEVLVLRMQTVGSVEERVAAVAAEKRGLADRGITGGFFDGKTSASERQSYLLSLLKADEGGGRNRSGQLTNAEINQMMARSEGEVELFEAEDRRIEAAEQRAWSQSAGDASRSTAFPPPPEFSRLALLEEVHPLVVAALEQLAPQDPDTGREFGKGKRARKDVNYGK